jgi:DnaK suppressor protein
LRYPRDLRDADTRPLVAASPPDRGGSKRRTSPRETMSTDSDDGLTPAVTGGARKATNGGLDPERLQAVREALRQKRSELVEQQATQLSALHAPDKHHLADLEEMASDTLDTDSLCALMDLSTSTLADIDAALLKIDEGTYGACELCGDAIHPDRLEVLPFAALCVACQRKKEAGEG